MRTVTLSLLLVAVGVVGCSASPSSTPAPSASASTGESLAIELSDFMLDPSSATVAGPSITIDVTNAGPTPHNLSIRDGEGDLVAATEDLSTGDAQTLSVELEPGDYVIFCSLAGHESLGMTGTLTVTSGS